MEKKSPGERTSRAACLCSCLVATAVGTYRSGAASWGFSAPCKHVSDGEKSPTAFLLQPGTVLLAGGTSDE